jgi:hypothetical protein
MLVATGSYAKCWLRLNKKYLKSIIDKMNYDILNRNMDYLMVDIFEYSFDYFPGYASCKFIDVFEKLHYINEKIPVVSSENIWVYNKDTILPQKGYIAGEIIKRENNVVTFSTIKPFCIETSENISVFCVYEN